MSTRKKWSETMAYVAELNKTHGVSQKGGKLYTQVVHRMEALREHHGLDFGVTTEILVDDGTRVVVKATIHTQDVPMITLGTGHAEELRGAGLVNKTSAIENCETSAIGRALSAIGLSGGEYASANELDGVERKTQAKAQPAKNVRTGAELAEDYIRQINGMHTQAELQGWLTANASKLEQFENQNKANAELVKTAVKERAGKIAESPEKGEVPSDAVAPAPNDDPTPAPVPLPDPNNEDNIPF